MNKNENYLLLTKAACDRAQKAIALVVASLLHLKAYDAQKTYSPKELEPYDALCDRFVRAVEGSIKFFRTYELFLYGENSDTLRDLLHRMEKINLVTAVPKWIDMRNIRNRIVHEYSPEQTQDIYNHIMHEFSEELKTLDKQLCTLKF